VVPYHALGKFWHRHRRPRPVEYTCDADYHLSKREAESGKPISNRKKGGAAVLRAQNSNAATPGEASPHPRGEGSSENSKAVVTSHLEDERAASPASSTSSDSEPPLAMKVKLNGTNHAALTHSASSESDVRQEDAPPDGHIRPTPGSTGPVSFSNASRNVVAYSPFPASSMVDGHYENFASKVSRGSV
jgi:SWI/SNF-related matrix-associated actin-dependent regulator of chromatin subfamily B protein 1